MRGRLVAVKHHLSIIKQIVFRNTASEIPVPVRSDSNDSWELVAMRREFAFFVEKVDAVSRQACAWFGCSRTGRRGADEDGRVLAVLHGPAKQIRNGRFVSIVEADSRGRCRVRFEMRDQTPPATS